MAKPKREYLILSCLASGIAVILSMVSLGTEQWIVAEARFTAQGVNERSSSVKYGLFHGVYEQKFPISTAFEITMTCLYKKNICAMLCKSTSDERIDELKKLINNYDVKFDISCPKVQRIFQNPAEVNNLGRPTYAKREFINAGFYLSTLLFLSIAQICGLLSTALAVWNTGGNPIHSLFNTFGLFIYNSLAAVSILMVLIIWGIQFQITLIDNACILNSITGKMETWANLGFSYWLNLGSFLLYCLSIIFLYIRKYKIQLELPETATHHEEINMLR